jgi:two-component system, cell cycle sensor histidine kinase and response regulator CckA
MVDSPQSLFPDPVAASEAAHNMLMEILAEVSGLGGSPGLPLQDLAKSLVQFYHQGPCGYHCLDATGLVVGINHTELHMLGYRAAEVIGKKRFVELLTPASQPVFLEASRRLEQSGSVRDLELELICKNGEILPVSFSATAIYDDQDNYVNSQSVVLDIRDRKQSQAVRQQVDNQHQVAEQRLRDLLAASPSVLYSCETITPFGCTFISDNIQLVMGYTRQDFLQDSDFWASRIHPEDCDRVFKSLEQLFATGQHVEEYRFLHQDGHYRWVQDQTRLVRDSGGNAVEIVGSWVDISDRKHLENQFLRAQRLESLGMLASGIAHDLNNILTPIMGIVQLLPKKVQNLDASTQRLLTILDETTHRGADLVKQILSFTQGLEGTPTNTQIRHIIAEVQKIIRQTFPKNIDLITDIAPDLWLISADPTLMHQVLVNLCVNARDAMPDGGNLEISAQNLMLDEHYARMHLDAQVGPYIAITISDTGQGIAPEHLDRIFDPFFTTKDLGKGTGLGLSTVLGIVKSHHGFLNVYSDLGKGSRFKLYLPANQSLEAPPDPDPTLPMGNGQLILIVDDELGIQEITRATLETYGYRTLVASDGIEAIALYAQHQADISLVLIDLMMPSLDTATAIRTLGKLNPQVKLIAMSGLATQESIAKATSEPGVVAFLAKPFTTPELLNRLAQYYLGNSGSTARPSR